jgi:hypothetical protein
MAVLLAATIFRALPKEILAMPNFCASFLAIDDLPDRGGPITTT